MTAIHEVKQKADIVDVMSQYNVKLEKMGRNYRALCPFHSEKHASFFVFPDQQRWRCFGACATGGDVISFVMKREGLDFSQALHLLADRAGVKLSQASREQDAARDRLFAINAAAADYFHHSLTSTPQGEKALAYLDKRCISTSSISAFQIGYSPEGWDSLKNHLLSHGHAENDLLSAGLVVEREGRGYYDRFRNRLMFPIRDAQGRITGFGGRALDDSLPKYMNSPQTAIFDKSSTVYGVDRAKAAIKRENRVVIVEGYMDVIMAHQYGFENVVASMGTSLTEKQAVILRKLTRRFTLALDSDAAGTEATRRGADTLDRALEHRVVPVPTQRGLVKYESEVDAELSVIALPPGKDPDEVIKEEPAAWRLLVDQALPLMDYVLSVAASRADLHEPNGRSKIVDQVLPVISEIKEPVRQSSYLQKLAQLVKLNETVLWDALKESKGTIAKQKSRIEPRHRVVPSSAFSNPLEDYCLALLLQNPELKTECSRLSLELFERGGLSLEELFEDSSARELAVRWLQSDNLEKLRTDIEQTLSRMLEQLLVKKLPPANPNERCSHLKDCVERLYERWLRDQIEAGVEVSEAVVENPCQQRTTKPERLNELFHQPKGRQRLKKKAP